MVYIMFLYTNKILRAVFQVEPGGNVRVKSILYIPHNNFVSLAFFNDFGSQIYNNKSILSIRKPGTSKPREVKTQLIETGVTNRYLHIYINIT